jgi:hypothetical protein
VWGKLRRYVGKNKDELFKVSASILVRNDSNNF